MRLLQKITGSKMERCCDLCHITLNKNAVVGDVSAMTPGGVRIGAPAMTSRGLREADFEQVAEFLHEAMELCKDLQNKHGRLLKDFNKWVSLAWYQLMLCAYKQSLLQLDMQYVCAAMLQQSACEESSSAPLIQKHITSRLADSPCAHAGHWMQTQESQSSRRRLRSLLAALRCQALMSRQLTTKLAMPMALQMGTQS